jgi:hypothetical protein
MGFTELKARGADAHPWQSNEQELAMKQSTKTLTGLIAASALLVGASGAAFSGSDQSTSGYPSMMGGPGMMGGQGMMGGPGMMRASPADTAARLDNLKRELAITPAQDAAWNAYRQAVINQSALMNAHRQTMWSGQTLPTADQRVAMHQQGWPMMQQTAQSADALYRSLTPEQRSKAGSLLAFQPGRGAVR